MRKLIIAVMLCAYIAIPKHLLALNPSKEYKVTPDKFGMSYKEEKIKTPDGSILNGWFFELSKKTTNWVIMSGSGDGNMADNIEIANSFLSAGFNVVMYDYRGYGASSEFKIDPELFIYPQFIVDLNAVADYLRKSRAITKFNLYGKGIGAGLSIGVGANRTETLKVIADGPWIGLEVMKKKIKEKTGKEINMPFGFDKNHEPMYAMDKPKGMKGLLVIVSPQDNLVGPSDVKAIKGISETYIIKASSTNEDNFSTDKNAYFEKISKFLSN
jgi:alpha/beta superfamily hydrolase